MEKQRYGAEIPSLRKSRDHRTIVLVFAIRAVYVCSLVGRGMLSKIFCVWLISLTLELILKQWSEELLLYKSLCVSRLWWHSFAECSFFPLPGGVSKYYLMPFKFKKFQTLIFRSAPLAIDLVPGWLPRLFSGSSSDVPNWMEISQEYLNLWDYHRFEVSANYLGKFLLFQTERMLWRWKELSI